MFDHLGHRGESGRGGHQKRGPTGERDTLLLGWHPLRERLRRVHGLLLRRFPCPLLRALARLRLAALYVTRPVLLRLVLRGRGTRGRVGVSRGGGRITALLGALRHLLLVPFALRALLRGLFFRLRLLRGGAAAGAAAEVGAAASDAAGHRVPAWAPRRNSVGCKALTGDRRI